MEKGPVFGLNIGDLLTIYDHDTQSWKMSECLFTGDFARYSEALPKSGMMRNGKLYVVVSLDCPISGAGCGLLPTPNKLAVIGQWASAKYLLIGNGVRKSGAKVGSNLSWILSKWHLQNGGKPENIIPDPCLSETMMGYQENWTDLKDSATQLSLK